MNQIERWSKLYGIEKSVMDKLYSADSSVDAFYNNLNLATRILIKNSELLGEFLKALPSPKKFDGIGISIDFMFPTEEALAELFQGDFHPIFRFSESNEVATLFLDQNGEKFCAVPGECGQQIYLQATAAWEKGFKRLVTEEMPEILKSGFFVYEMKIGGLVDSRKENRITTHEEVGVGGGSDGYYLFYVCGGRIYNPSAGMGGDLNGLKEFWSKDSHKTLEAGIKRINSKFFKRKKQKLRKNPIVIW